MTIIQFIQITLTVLAIANTLIFRYRDKRKKKLFYIFRNRIILENKLNDEKVVIKYNDEKTKKLVQTEVLIFNKSGQTIKFEEIGKTLGLQLVFSQNTSLFNVKILEYNNPNVNLTYHQENNKIKLYFDYFKNENYVLMKFISDENNYNKPELLGEFINKDKILKFNSLKFKMNQFIRVIPYILIGSTMLGFVCEYYKIPKEIYYIITFIFGLLSVDIFGKILDKKIDKRIKDMITE